MIKSVKIFTLIVICVSLFSCTSNKGELTEKLIAEEFEYFEQHRNEWKQLKPDLLELIAMKKELQELIIELNKLADIPQTVTPMPTNAEQVNIISAAPESKKVTVNSTLANNSYNLPYAIQLGSYSQLSKLKKVWSDINATEALLLKNKTAISEKTTKNKLTFYRLKAIPYDKESAKKACKILREQQHSCIVSTPYGKAL